MLAHFLPPLFDNTGHNDSFLGEFNSAILLRRDLSPEFGKQVPLCRLTTYHRARKGVKETICIIPVPSPNNHLLSINSLDPLQHSSSL